MAALEAGLPRTAPSARPLRPDPGRDRPAARRAAAAPAAVGAVARGGVSRPPPRSSSPRSSSPADRGEPDARAAVAGTPQFAGVSGSATLDGGELLIEPGARAGSAHRPPLRGLGAPHRGRRRDGGRRLVHTGRRPCEARAAAARAWRLPGRRRLGGSPTAAPPSTRRSASQAAASGRRPQASAATPVGSCCGASPGSGVRGSQTTNVAPAPVSEKTPTEPRCASAI